MERRDLEELVERRMVLFNQRKGLLARVEKLDDKIGEIDRKLEPYSA